MLLTTLTVPWRTHSRRPVTPSREPRSSSGSDHAESTRRRITSTCSACRGHASTRGRRARSGHCPPAAESRAARRRRPGRRRSRVGARAQHHHPRVLDGSRRRVDQRDPHGLEERGQPVQVSLLVDPGSTRRRHGGSASRIRRRRAPACGRRSPSTGRRSSGQDQPRQ